MLSNSPRFDELSASLGTIYGSPTPRAPQVPITNRPCTAHHTNLAQPKSCFSHQGRQQVIFEPDLDDFSDDDGLSEGCYDDVVLRSPAATVNHVTPSVGQGAPSPILVHHVLKSTLDFGALLDEDDDDESLLGQSELPSCAPTPVQARQTILSHVHHSFTQPFEPSLSGNYPTRENEPQPEDDFESSSAWDGPSDYPTRPPAVRPLRDLHWQRQNPTASVPKMRPKTGMTESPSPTMDTEKGTDIYSTPTRHALRITSSEATIVETAPLHTMAFTRRQLTEHHPPTNLATSQAFQSQTQEKHHAPSFSRYPNHYDGDQVWTQLRSKSISPKTIITLDPLRAYTTSNSIHPSQEYHRKSASRPDMNSTQSGPPQSPRILEVAQPIPAATAIAANNDHGPHHHHNNNNGFVCDGSPICTPIEAAPTMDSTNLDRLPSAAIITSYSDFQTGQGRSPSKFKPSMSLKRTRTDPRPGTYLSGNVPPKKVRKGSPDINTNLSLDLAGRNTAPKPPRLIPRQSDEPLHLMIANPEASPSSSIDRDDVSEEPEAASSDSAEPEMELNLDSEEDEILESTLLSIQAAEPTSDEAVTPLSPSTRTHGLPQSEKKGVLQDPQHIRALVRVDNVPYDALDNLEFVGIERSRRPERVQKGRSPLDVEITRSLEAVASPTARIAGRYPTRKRVQTLRWWCSERINYIRKPGETTLSIGSVSTVKLEGDGFWRKAEYLRHGFKQRAKLPSLASAPTLPALEAGPQNSCSRNLWTSPDAAVRMTLDALEYVDPDRNEENTSTLVTAIHRNGDEQWHSLGNYLICSRFHISGTWTTDQDHPEVGASVTLVKLPPQVSIEEDTKDHAYSLIIVKGKVRLFLPKMSTSRVLEAATNIVIKPRVYYELHNEETSEEAVIRFLIRGQGLSLLDE